MQTYLYLADVNHVFICQKPNEFLQWSPARSRPPTLLLLHVGEVFKREGSHRGSPEGVGLHDGLQAGPDRHKRERQIV